MPFYLKSIIDKQGIDSMKHRIINAVGSTIPFAGLTHDFYFFVNLMCTFQFLSDDKFPFLVIEAHSSTCLSCSTFL